MFLSGSNCSCRIEYVYACTKFSRRLLYVFCPSAGAEEENAFNVVITEEDSRDDVLQKIVDIIKEC